MKTFRIPILALALAAVAFAVAPLLNALAAVPRALASFAARAYSAVLDFGVKVLAGPLPMLRSMERSRPERVIGASLFKAKTSTASDRPTLSNRWRMCPSI